MATTTLRKPGLSPRPTALDPGALIGLHLAGPQPPTPAAAPTPAAPAPVIAPPQQRSTPARSLEAVAATPAFTPPDAVVGNTGQGGQFTPPPAPPPIAPGAPPAAPPAPPQAPAAPNVGDYSSDPTLQEIIRTENEAANHQVSSDDDQIRQLLISAGLKDVAQSQLGADSPYLSAITEDPNGTSEASRINKSYIDKAHATDEDLNDQGLFHSGARVGKLADLGHQQVLDKTDLTSRLLAAIGGLRDDQVGARTGAKRNIATGEAAARDRAIQLALQYGLGAGKGGPLGGDNGKVAGADYPALTQTTSGQTSFTPEQIATIAALPINQPKKAAPATVATAATKGNARAKLA